MNAIAIDLTQQAISLAELLNLARQGIVILRDASGEQFILSYADNFTLEIALLKQNSDFLAYLDACKSEQNTLSLDDVEKMLR